MLERRRLARCLSARGRLPVVRHERPLAPRERQRGERLRLADEHVAAGVGGEAERLIGRRHSLALDFGVLGTLGGERE